MISKGELYFEKLWGHGCHKDSEGSTSTPWVQGYRSQDGPQQGKAVLGPFYIMKISYILLRSPTTKLSRNPTTKMLSSFQNLIRNWSPFQKIMSPNAVLGRQYNTAGSVHVYRCRLHSESTCPPQPVLHYMSSDGDAPQHLHTEMPYFQIISNFDSSSLSQLRGWLFLQ